MLKISAEKYFDKEDNDALLTKFSSKQNYLTTIMIFMANSYIYKLTEEEMTKDCCKGSDGNYYVPVYFTHEATQKRNQIPLFTYYVQTAEVTISITHNPYTISLRKFCWTIDHDLRDMSFIPINGNILLYQSKYSKNNFFVHLGYYCPIKNRIEFNVNIFCECHMEGNSVKICNQTIQFYCCWE